MEDLQKGNETNIRKTENIPIKPKSLLGMALNIPYNGKKYHSGTICSGVTNAFANI